MMNGSKIRVGVLRGGTGYGYDVSLKSGSVILKNLSEKSEKYIGIDLLMTKDGTLHIGGVPISISDLTNKVDVVLNILYGEYGEDGKLQRDLESFGVSHTSSKMLSSALAMNKVLTKKYFKDTGIKIPVHKIINTRDNISEKARQIFRTIPQPSIVKPMSGGLLFDTFKVESYDELVLIIEKVLKKSDNVIVEEYISGKEASCIIVDNFRDEDLYVFPPIGIQYPKFRKTSGSNTKNNTNYDEGRICPGYFSKKENAEVMRLAKLAHKSLGMRYYSKTDFIVSPRGIYALESNSLPVFTDTSLLSKSLNAVGSNITEFLDHIITLALDGK